MAKWLDKAAPGVTPAAPAPPEVLGYSAQVPRTVEQVNKNKVLEELMLRMIDQHTQSPECDQRWVSVARTHMQEGFMALNRSVFKPGRVPGDLDLSVFKDLL